MLALQLCLLVVVVTVVSADVELLILHNNDMHSRFEETNEISGSCPDKHKGKRCYGGFARVAHVVREARKKAETGEGPPVVFLNAGDTYTGTAWFTVHRWRIAADFLNAVHPDAASLGNHEFDNGVAGLVPFLNAVKFPIVTANVDFSKEPTLAVSPLQKSTIINVDGMSIGVIGYLTPETQIISQTENVIFESEVEAINKEASKLNAKGIKTIIAVGHSGFEMDKIIARDCPLVDVVIGGHTNTFLYTGPQPDIEVPEGLYPTEITQPSGKKVPVVQAYAYTKYMGKLKVTIDSDGHVKGFKGQPMLLNSTVPQEKDVLDLLEKYRPEVNNLDAQVMGRTKVVLDNSECRKKECNFGNLIADAFVAYKSFYYGGSYWTDTPIAIQNGGGIRNSVDATLKGGNITRGDLLGVLPFDNPMIGISLKGTDLIEMLETGLRYNGTTSRGEYLQFSGIKLIYDSSKPSGSRVVAAYARCGVCSVPKYEEVLPDKEYRLMVTNFLLTGGDGFSVIKDKAFKIKKEDFNDVDMVAWYLNKYNPVFPEISGRIIDLADENEKATFRSSVGTFKPQVSFILFLAFVLSQFY